jgi:hypothetical protein
MQVPLPAGLPYAYSLIPDGTVELTVTGDAPVSYGYLTTPVDEPDGTLAPGEAPVTLDTPGWLLAEAETVAELVYSDPPPVEQPPDPPPPEP